MKTSIKLMFISILLVILTCTCEKEENENPLPPNTEIGANTFIFRVNGGEIIESQVGYLPTSPRIYIYYCHIDSYLDNDFLFHIDGTRCFLEHNKTVSIYIKYMTKVGKYKLHIENDYAAYSVYENTSLQYYTDEENTGELNIVKLDTTNHILSGKFVFSAKQYCWEEECNDIVTIDGQFDVKYKPNEGVNYY